jgi:hypothetical protein
MCDRYDDLSESETHGFSTGRSHSFCTSWCESSTDADSPLTRYTNAPEFHAFKELLRRAVHELSVADFAAVRRYYDAAWLEVLEEL